MIRNPTVAEVRRIMRALGYAVVERSEPAILAGDTSYYSVSRHMIVLGGSRAATLAHELCHSQQPAVGPVSYYRADGSPDPALWLAARKERERLQAEAARAEQAARERREREKAKARELEAKGRAEQAAARRQAAMEAEEANLRDIEAKRLAAEAMPMQPVVHLEQPKVSGVSARKLWKFEIVDMGLIPREFMIPNETAIGAVVRAMRDQTNIPGVRVYSESSYASRSE